MKKLTRISVILCVLIPLLTSALQSQTIEVFTKTFPINPLDEVVISCSLPGTITVKDSKNREYFRGEAGCRVPVLVAGAAGSHTAVLSDKKGRFLSSASFNVNTETRIDDGGIISDMFRLFYTGMLVYDPDGVDEITWNGKTYRYFVHWVLDNNNTMRGMQYFSPFSRDLVDLLRENQEPNGMIWSFVNKGEGDSHYYNTAYSPINYFKKDKDAWFVRQPSENHVEYNFVNMMFQHWKASGDQEWMRKNLDCAARALDYCVTDTVRWSKRFQLLKRPYCIDSWDFQVDDEYTPYAPISPTMVIVPGKTKFGIFFGDNTGYYEACIQLAEMFAISGNNEKAQVYSHRGKEILDRLIKLSWNGRFFTHFIDEDPAVKRNLGVDEKSQIAQGNMYSVNRGLSHEMDVAIINTYLELKNNLPVGSPGEWYAIYPPFERGFGQHNTKWQYMNGGVAPHAAAELSRGAYENGYENYASEILLKIHKQGRENGNRVWFALTGSIPPPPPDPVYKTVDIAGQANMDLWDKGAKDVYPWMNTSREGNDMRGLPVGDQEFNSIKFRIIDPEINGRRTAIGISTLKGFPEKMEVPINDSAATVYLLHSSSDNIPANVAGVITFRYDDGSFASQYLMKGRDVTNWWFSSLENDRAGVAWWGPNPVSTKVGVCWAAITNPFPDKKIRSLVFHAPLEGGIYTVIGISLADRVHYIKPKFESFGGPDNWAAANAMAALVEGLAGIRNDDVAFNKVTLSPRWISADVDSVHVNVKFAASEGYVSYIYNHDRIKKTIKLQITGSGESIKAHILLPANDKAVQSVMVNGITIEFSTSVIEESQYVDFELSIPVIQDVIIQYS
jgi:hypothetical protein